MKRNFICMGILLTLSVFLYTGCGFLPKESAKPQSDTSAENSTENTSGDSLEHPDGAATEDTDGSLNVGADPNQTDAPDADTPSNPEDASIPESDADTALMGSLSDMEIVLESLMLACEKKDISYDSENSIFLWSALYYGVINHSGDIAEAKTVDTQIQVPSGALGAFAKELFITYSKLPKIPDELPDITYSHQLDAYCFTLPEKVCPDFSTTILNAQKNQDGSISATVVLYNQETKQPLCCYLFTLSPKDSLMDSQFLFPYGVTSMTRCDAVNSPGDLPSLIGKYQGFTDEHTLELTIDGNLMTFQVYDPNVISILSLLKENEEFTFSVLKDKSTESRTITSILGK